MQMSRMAPVKMEQGRFDWEDQDNEISCLKEDLAKLQAKEQEQVVEITRALRLRSSNDALSTDFNRDRP